MIDGPQVVEFGPTTRLAAGRDWFGRLWYLGQACVLAGAPIIDSAQRDNQAQSRRPCPMRLSPASCLSPFRCAVDWLRLISPVKPLARRSHSTPTEADIR